MAYASALRGINLTAGKSYHATYLWWQGEKMLRLKYKHKGRTREFYERLANNYFAMARREEKNEG